MPPEHKRQSRIREFEELICDEEGCDFFGQPARGGVCFNSEPDFAPWEKLAKVAEEFAEELKPIRSSMTDQEYIQWLEAMYECAMMNWTFGLDELIRLRVEVARMKLRMKDAEGNPEAS